MDDKAKDKKKKNLHSPAIFISVPRGCDISSLVAILLELSTCMKTQVAVCTASA